MGKYKVLIVDDEYFIREGLKTLIDWQQAGFDIIGEAGDGKQALEMIEKYKPDLCIVDIKMPLMDGLELIEAVTKERIGTRFIILSGHGEFEYAKKAMELEVRQYVLKPIDADELYKKIIEEKQIIEKLQYTSVLTKRNMLKKIVTGKLDDYSLWNQQYEPAFPWRIYQVIAIEEKDGQVSEEMVEALEEAFEGCAYGYISGKQMIFLLKDKAYQKVTQGLDNIRNIVEQKHDCQLYMAAGGKKTVFIEIEASYNEAAELMFNRFLYEEDTILTMDLHQKDKCGQIDTDKYLHSLIHAIRFNDMRTINDMLEEYLEMQEQGGCSEDAIIANYVHMYVLLMTKLNQETALSRHIFEGLVVQKNLRKLHGFFKYQIVQLADQMSLETVCSPVEKIRHIIDEDYGNELKLEEIAKELGYNSAYLGKQFKSATGTYFNQYLDQVRIEKSKILLKETSKKIYEIAEAVGYSSADYFTMKFKKYEFMSPKRYRVNLESDSK